ncbi:uncharacterized protein PgNI_11619 [Pyricularia grisea]|uniref:Uncharacterized protein n=1 Tax=Pyricularia grisea TaxID=148305 RepID=A0A6P8ANM6_PYRGI|nr:uncharacterized protein PgNI_11619 [Pyricularia grisea]TLD03635.1 hypothetical protein PgNI_11619 [Pyricularia grisea]
MVRQCKVEYDRDKWLYRLSKAKRKAFGTLLKNYKITEAFDKLMEFPGVIAGLQFGNIHRYLALHIDEELLCYFEYIYKTWDCILQIDNCPPPKLLVDLASVTNLRGTTLFRCLTQKDYWKAPKRALQNIREEKIPARKFEETKTYLNKLALCVGFDNPKIQKIRDNPNGEKRGPKYNFRKATFVEWRNGISFTRIYLELKSTGFLHRIKY